MASERQPTVDFPTSAGWLLLSTDLMTLFLTLTIATKARVLPEAESAVLHWQPQPCSALASILFETILFLPTDNGPPVSSLPAQCTHRLPPQTCPHMRGKSFPVHSFFISCPFLQLIIALCLFFKEEEEVEEQGGRKWKRRNRKETPTMSQVHFKLYKSAKKLDSYCGKNHGRVSVLNIHECSSQI